MIRSKGVDKDNQDVGSRMSRPPSFQAAGLGSVALNSRWTWKTRTQTTVLINIIASKFKLKRVDL